MYIWNWDVIILLHLLPKYEHVDIIGKKTTSLMVYNVPGRLKIPSLTAQTWPVLPSIFLASLESAG